MVARPGRSWFQWCALLGALGAVVIAIGFTTSPSGQPGDKASGQQVLVWFAAHHAAQQRTNYIIALGVVLLVFFFGMLVRWNGTRALWASLTGLAGFVIAASGFAFTGGVNGMLISGYTDYSAQTAQTLNVFMQDFFLPVLIGLAITAVGYSIAFLLSHELPRWVGIVGIIFGVGLALPAGAAFFAVLGIVAWVLLVSIWLCAKRPTVAAAASPEIKEVAV